MSDRSPDRRPSQVPREPLPGGARDWWGVAVAVLIYCCLGLWQLHLPGLYEDEALTAVPAARLLQGRGGGPYALLPGRLDLPLMVSDHVGPIETYLVLPFLAVFGVGATAVRVYGFLCGLVALVLIFLWARRVAPGMAWVAALLLAPAPSLWLAFRCGLYLSSAVVPLAAGALLCLDGWHRGRGARWLYGGSLLMGLGLATKILFVWMIAGIAIGVILANRPALGRLDRRGLVMGAGWLAVGAAPLIVFNLLSRGLTLRTLLANLGETQYGVRNAAFLTNLRTQIGSLASLLDGGWLAWAGDAPRDLAAPWLLAAAAGWVALRWRAPGWRRARCCVVALAVVVAASCFTITRLGPQYLLIALVLPAPIIAAALASAWQERRRLLGQIAFPALAALCLVQFAGDLTSSLRYHRALAATRGVGLFSTAHDDAAGFLAAEGEGRPLAGDWGLLHNVELASGGRVRPEPIFELEEAPPYPSTRAQARRALAAPGRLWLFHTEDLAVAPGRRAAVEQEAAAMGMDLRRVAVFGDGLGRPVVLVYRSVAAGPRPEAGRR